MNLLCSSAVPVFYRVFFSLYATSSSFDFYAQKRKFSPLPEFKPRSPLEPKASDLPMTYADKVCLWEIFKVFGSIKWALTPPVPHGKPQKTFPHPGPGKNHVDKGLCQKLPGKVHKCETRFRYRFPWQVLQQSSRPTLKKLLTITLNGSRSGTV